LRESVADFTTVSARAACAAALEALAPTAAPTTSAVIIARRGMSILETTDE
jgi:hypothetical protein